MNEIPNPGSFEAVEAGCTCPIHDNNYGEGNQNSGGHLHDGLTTFWITAGCPIHDPQEEE